MTAHLVPLLIVGGLTACGVYLLLARNLTRMLLGLLMVSNAVSLLILTVGGPSGNPPIRDRTSGADTTTADPLAQALILTAIVITMGVGAFVLALIYRAFRLSAEENIANDPENSRLAALSGGAGWLDADWRSSVEYPDTDEPDELDARPRGEGSR